MKKKVLIIKNIEGYEYSLMDIENKEYQLNIELMGINFKLKVGDSILISNELLDENYSEYSRSYTFGNLNDNSGRKITEKNKQEVIVVRSDNKEYYLKRLYG